METENFRNESRQWLRSIERKSLAAACVLLLGSLVYRSALISLGVALGSALSIINFRLLWKIAEPAFIMGIKPHGKLALKIIVKMIGLLGVILLVVYLDVVNVLGFLAGLSSVVLGIVLEGIVHLYRYPRPQN